MTYTYRPFGVCSSKIEIQLDGETITSVRFDDGCNGNGKGLSALARGRNAKEVAQMLGGVRCEEKDTSCPDQLSRALCEMLKIPYEGGGAGD